MLKNYLKIALRNLVRNKVSAFINIGGLAVGMAVAMLIGLWIYDELSFNKYHQNYEHIARVYRQETWRGERGTGTSMQIPVGTELRSVYANDFTYVVTSSWPKKHILDAEAANKAFSQSGLYLQPEGPEMLTLKMRQGSRSGLKDPHAILISETLAQKFFGDANPMGKILKINNQMAVKVTGVYEDLPANSEFKDISFMAPWDLLLASDEYLRSLQNNWESIDCQILVQIAPNTTFAQVESKIKDVLLRHLSGDYAAAKPALILHPMRQWHLYSKFKDGPVATIVTSDELKFVWFYGIIGAFVLTLACINFMNLSTARSQKRAKEVGIRKTMGSLRAQLVGQFLSESLVVASFAFGLALVLVQLILPWFNNVAGKEIKLLGANLSFWLAGLGFTLFTGLLAGSYPALYLSSFHPIKALKGTLRVSHFALLPRKVLVVVQFSVSIALIIGTVIVYRQIQYTKDRPVGYTRNGLLLLEKTSPDFYNKSKVLSSELRNTGVVYEVAEAASPVTGLRHSNNGFDWKDKDPAMYASFATETVTPAYGRTVGWQFVQGQDFFSGLASDSLGFVINESAAKFMGLKQPVGEFVRWDPGWRKATTFKIIGIVKDMVTESPFEPVKPTIFYLQDDKNWIYVRINPQVNAREALPKIEAVFKKVTPAAPFDYTFADQEYATKFAAEERIGKLAGFFASLAIFISCLGLFGLASFTAEQRTKEIGIRKVLGATAFSLWRLLSKDFVVLVLISLLIAAPAAYYFLAQWLQNYTYRTPIAGWVFVLAGGGALLMALLTVSYQAVKALRSE